ATPRRAGRRGCRGAAEHKLKSLGDSSFDPRVANRISSCFGTVSPILLTSSIALFTNTPPFFSESFEGMSCDAGGFVCVLSSWTDSSTYIFAESHGFEMIWVDTARVPTEMIDNQSG